jgi:hypothetical protein
MQDVDSQGHNVAATVRVLLAEEPLGDLPTQDLRYRLVARLDVNLDASPKVPSPEGSSPGTARNRNHTAPSATRPPGLRR